MQFNKKKRKKQQTELKYCEKKIVRKIRSLLQKLVIKWFGYFYMRT